MSSSENKFYLPLFFTSNLIIIKLKYTLISTAFSNEVIRLK